jgi:hypothetical protein
MFPFNPKIKHKKSNYDSKSDEYINEEFSKPER